MVSMLTDFMDTLDNITSFSPHHKRWEIENQGFDDAKNCYGFGHILPSSPDIN